MGVGLVQKAQDEPPPATAYPNAPDDDHEVNQTHRLLLEDGQNEQISVPAWSNSHEEKWAESQARPPLEAPQATLAVKTEAQVAMAEKTANSTHNQKKRLPVKRGNGSVISFTKKWSSPITMLLGLIAAAGFAAGHHSYYMWLDGQVVRDTARQQWSLRIGNLFAVAVAFSLKLAVGNAYLQYTWLRLRQKHTSLKTIDAAFALTGDIFEFLHSELYKKLRISLVLALMIWCIPIASIFPPATLSVIDAIDTSPTSFQVLQPAIADPGRNNSYIAEFPGSYFLDVSPLLSNLVDSVASIGETFSPKALSTEANYSYSLQTYMPRFICRDGVPELATRIVNASSSLLGFYLNTSVPIEPDTFAFENISSPIGSSSGLLFYMAMAGTKGLDSSHLDLSSEDSQGVFRGDVMDNYISELDGTIVLGMTTSPRKIKYASCTLCNSSFEIEVTFINGVGTTNVKQVNDGNPFTDFKQGSSDAALQEGEERLYAYYYWFRKLSASIVGIWFSYTDTIRPDVLDGTSSVSLPTMTVRPDQTILAQAEDFSQMLQYFYKWNGARVTVDSAAVRPKNLAEVIEELSMNVSLSLLSQPALCRTISTIGTISTLKTVYQYQPMNLWISYGVAIFCSIATVVVGYTAFLTNGESHDFRVSRIGRVMQNPELFEILRQPIDACDGKWDETYLDTKMKLATYSTLEQTGESSNGGDGTCEGNEYVGFILRRRQARSSEGD